MYIGERTNRPIESPHQGNLAVPMPDDSPLRLSTDLLKLMEAEEIDAQGVDSLIRKLTDILSASDNKLTSITAHRVRAALNKAKALPSTNGNIDIALTALKASPVVDE